MFDRTVVMSGENTKEYIPYAQTVTVNHAPTSEQAEYLEKLQGEPLQFWEENQLIFIAKTNQMGWLNHKGPIA